MIEYSSLARPPGEARKGGGIRKQKRERKRGLGGGRRKEERDEPKRESNHSALNHGPWRGVQKSHHGAMKNGCWFSKSADLCSSRVQWPPSLSCPSSRCYSYAVSNTSPTIHETGRSFLFFFAFEIHKKKKKKGECRPSFIPPIIFPDTLDLSYSQYLRAAKINECLAAR